MSLLKKHAGGKYLAADDFGERLYKEAGVVLTIAGLSEANVAREDQREEIKLIVAFEDSKSLVANKTNTNMIVGLFGSEDNHAIGKKIGLYVDPDVKNKGKTVKGLRLCDHNEIGDQANDVPF